MEARAASEAQGAVADIQLEQTGRIATLTFNRPDARNAMTWAMYEALHGACDRLDNDLGPAAEAGLHTAFVKRGPWGYIIYQPGSADLELDSLTELPDALTRLSAD